MASDPAGRCWPRWHAEPADMCRPFGLDRPRVVSAWTATGARNAAAGPGWVCPGPAAVGIGLCIGHQVLLSVCGCACQLTVVPARRVRDGWRAGGGCAGQAVGPRVRGGRLGPSRRLEMSRRWPSAFSLELSGGLPDLADLILRVTDLHDELAVMLIAELDADGLGRIVHVPEHPLAVRVEPAGRNHTRHVRAAEPDAVQPFASLVLCRGDGGHVGEWDLKAAFQRPQLVRPLDVNNERVRVRVIDPVMAYLSSVRWVAFCLAPWWWWWLCGPRWRWPAPGEERPVRFLRS